MGRFTTKTIVCLGVAAACALSLVCRPASAARLFRFDTGVFNGRIANTSNFGGVTSTYPYNTASSMYYYGEFQWGKGTNWRILLGLTSEAYPGKVVKASGAEVTPLNYGDYRLGAVYATSCCEWRLIYARTQTPYTYMYTNVTADGPDTYALP